MTGRTRDKDYIAPMELDPGGAVVVVPDDRPAAAAGEVTADSELPEPVPAPRRWAVRLLVGSAAALVALAVGYDTVDLVRRAFETSVLLGGGAVALAGGAVLGGFGLLAGELRSLRRLRRIDGLREEAEHLRTSGTHGEAARYAGAVASLYGDRRDLSAQVQALRDNLSDAHDDREVVRMVDLQLLQDIDRRSYQLVLRAARDTAVATALSPAALLDVVIVLWRNLKLVREVATLYGARPGYVGSLKLLRRMLANIAIAGVAESGNDLMVEALGSTLAASLSTRVGQGVINGLLTARVGLTAMHLCRPLAYDETNRPSLRRIRRELLKVPKQVL
ncbi:TIGR01620 family protein [Skermanella pratensis]|uniref:TIGR01620 family protein n=1 Tax=Skermanella pratensis TaxID=2233999 RepID=UPI00130198A5|nr:TIGR01620 family protein [Skermanella pratensis]